MNRKFAIGGLAAACVMLSACATVTRGTSQKFNIETSPTAADVKLSTGQTCVSPCQLKLKRKSGFVVTATKAGHEKAMATVEAKVRGGGAAGAAGNILLGGVIGVAVDATNGSMNDLTPNPLLLTLKPLPVEPAAAMTEAATAAPAEATPVVAAPAETSTPVTPAPTENSAAAEAEQPAPGL